jgi:hemolysin III
MYKHIFSKEEWANILTHGLSIPFCFWGSYALLTRINPILSNSVFYGLLAFCMSMSSVYIISTLYHYQSNPRIKHMLRIMDHIAIYFLIAGTHTPFLLLYLPTTYGQYILAGLWICVFFGTIFKAFFIGRYEKTSLAIYIAMGWSGVLTFPYIWEAIPVEALLGIGVGGLSYTVGAYFYARNDIPYNHAFWHLFVIGGSLGHYLALWYCVT